MDLHPTVIHLAQTNTQEDPPKPTNKAGGVKDIFDKILLHIKNGIIVVWDYTKSGA